MITNTGDWKSEDILNTGVNGTKYNQDQRFLSHPHIINVGNRRTWCGNTRVLLTSVISLWSRISPGPLFSVLSVYYKSP